MLWSTRPTRRLRLRRAAQRYAGHAWPVLPGAYLTGGRFDCGELGCPTISCHPAIRDWEQVATADLTRITTWWQRHEHGVLLATGYGFDVLEIAGTAGRLVARAADGPVAVAPRERWMFLVRPGSDLDPQLADHASVVLHQGGSWIPAPPTPLPGGRVRWAVGPERCDWMLPDAAKVQRAACWALDFDRQPRQVWRSWNQLAGSA